MSQRLFILLKSTNFAMNKIVISVLKMAYISVELNGLESWRHFVCDKLSR